eukprot:TRINITY_DN63104_c0_g1_i1.p1 TRINITY_DN63104_c0_g1~~TRINITY_DN63104_c0_g1_i1.p1  ORF type:complete len:497 (+),score=49.54 TRINITY_DN63104_c0_g1_i1:140-1630(+)
MRDNREGGSSPNDTATTPVAQWLVQNSLQEYIETFNDQGFIDLEDLQYFVLTDAAGFATLVTKKGHQSRIRRLLGLAPQNPSVNTTTTTTSSNWPQDPGTTTPGEDYADDSTSAPGHPSGPWGGASSTASNSGHGGYLAPAFSAAGLTHPQSGHHPEAEAAYHHQYGARHTNYSPHPPPYSQPSDEYPYGWEYSHQPAMVRHHHHHSTKHHSHGSRKNSGSGISATSSRRHSQPTSRSSSTGRRRHSSSGRDRERERHERDQTPHRHSSPHSHAWYPPGHPRSSNYHSGSYSSDLYNLGADYNTYVHHRAAPQTSLHTPTHNQHKKQAFPPSFPPAHRTPSPPVGNNRSPLSANGRSHSRNGRLSPSRSSSSHAHSTTSTAAHQPKEQSWFPGAGGPPPDLIVIYKYFCRFGDRENQGRMNSVKFAKFVREMNLLDYNLTITDVDLIFAKVKAPHTQTIDFDAFCDALPMLATVKHPGITGDDAVSMFLQDLSAVI